MKMRQASMKSAITASTTIVMLVLLCIDRYRVVHGFTTNSIAAHKQKIHKRPLVTQQYFFNGKKKEMTPEIVPGVGVDGRQLPSPSGINKLPLPAQAKAVVGIFAVLFLLTNFISSILTDLTLQYEWFQSFRYVWPLVLGPIYILLGATHFTVQDEYCNIVPPNNGTWGFWYLPGSAKFHVAWTGIAEILGGMGLLIGGVMDAFFPVYYSSPNLISPAGLESDSAALLLLLTIAITPSNIYMYTHGAKLPMDTDPLPISYHVIRGIIQAVIFALFFQLGEGTFDSILSTPV